VVCKNKSDIGNKRQLEPFQNQTIPEQHTGKTQNQEITENSHIGHCTHTAGSADVKVQKHISRAK
jgi:hypothetical protein